ncbi:hypothetical protein PIB30_071955 [Stylosanthes scabra]|uniref:Uncharacterized protein n=1 Tax=Stylosanthes scabra TaxID=79078 RepID=A0ABU6VQS4_9FABA|nr:hypothetical protein [Stylosanthes scabra]
MQQFQWIMNKRRAYHQNISQIHQEQNAKRPKKDLSFFALQTSPIVFYGAEIPQSRRRLRCCYRLGLLLLELGFDVEVGESGPSLLTLDQTQPHSLTFNTCAAASLLPPPIVPPLPGSSHHSPSLSHSPANRRPSFPSYCVVVSPSQHRSVAIAEHPGAVTAASSASQSSRPTVRPRSVRPSCALCSGEPQVYNVGTGLAGKEEGICNQQGGITYGYKSRDPFEP